MTSRLDSVGDGGSSVVLSMGWNRIAAVELGIMSSYSYATNCTFVLNRVYNNNRSEMHMFNVFSASDGFFIDFKDDMSVDYLIRKVRVCRFVSESDHKLFLDVFYQGNAGNACYVLVRGGTNIHGATWKPRSESSIVPETNANETVLVQSDVPFLQSTALYLYGGIEIAENTDLNDLMQIGTYYCSSTSVSRTILNFPGDDAFKMIIDRPYGTGIVIRQIIIEWYTMEMWYRVYSSGWRSWVKKF